MIKFISNKYFLTIIGILLLFIIWQVATIVVHEEVMILPGPFTTIKSSFILLGNPTTYIHIFYSFHRMLIGFLLSFACALVIGIIIGNFIKVKHIFNPTLITLKSVPTAALVLAFLSLVGAKSTPVFIVTIMSFPILLESVIGGITNIDKNVMMALKLEDKSFVEKNIKVKIPMATPYIFVGIASSFALSFKVEIMAEVISGNTGYGLGCAMVASRTGDNITNIIPLFGYAFIVVLLALLTSLIAYIVKSTVKIKK